MYISRGISFFGAGSREGAARAEGKEEIFEFRIAQQLVVQRCDCSKKRGGGKKKRGKFKIQENIPF